MFAMLNLQAHRPLTVELQAEWIWKVLKMWYCMLGPSLSQCNPHSKAGSGSNWRTFTRDRNAGVFALFWLLVIYHHLNSQRRWMAFFKKMFYTKWAHIVIIILSLPLSYICLFFLPLPVLLPVSLSHFLYKTVFLQPSLLLSMTSKFPMVTRGNMDEEGHVDLSKTKG